MCLYGEVFACSTAGWESVGIFLTTSEPPHHPNGLSEVHGGQLGLYFEDSPLDRSLHQRPRKRYPQILNPHLDGPHAKVVFRGATGPRGCLYLTDAPIATILRRGFKDEEILNPPPKSQTRDQFHAMARIRIKYVPDMIKHNPP